MLKPPAYQSREKFLMMGRIEIHLALLSRAYGLAQNIPSFCNSLNRSSAFVDFLSKSLFHPCQFHCFREASLLLIHFAVEAGQAKNLDPVRCLEPTPPTHLESTSEANRFHLRLIWTLEVALLSSIGKRSLSNAFRNSECCVEVGYQLLKRQISIAKAKLACCGNVGVVLCFELATAWSECLFLLA